MFASAQNVLYSGAADLGGSPTLSPAEQCSIHLAYEIRKLNNDPNLQRELCSAPRISNCITTPSLYQQAYASGRVSIEGSFVDAGFWSDSLNRVQCDHVVYPANIAGFCEDWIGRSRDYLSSYIAPGKCSCPAPRDPPNAMARTTWDKKKIECIACPLPNPTDLETLIAQYDTTEEAKACTRRLEVGERCDHLVKPALLTAKACLQTKMAEVGFAWDGSTTSLFRTRGYQAHFWDLFQKGWTRDNLAALSKSNPSGYKSCTPPPSGLHKNHGLDNAVANPDSVNPHHTTGSAFDIKPATVNAYEKTLVAWNLAHKKDVNYIERTVTSEAAACGLRWGQPFNDRPHFDLGR